MLNIKKIKKTGFFLIISGSLISGCASDNSIPKFAAQNAVSAVGVNFDTREIIVVNSVTGEKVLPCIPTVKIKQEARNHGTSATQECATEIISDKSNAALISALELSKKTIKGVIWKNGKKVSAKYVVTVKALYEGSICNTDYSGGNQYESCGRRRR